MADIPIPFADIGKSAKDLLGKDFPTDAVRLELKTTAPNGVSFKVSGSKDNKTGFVVGELETKYSDKKNGLTFTEAWTTSNLLNGLIELDNNLAKGLKLDLHSSLLSSAGQKNIKLSASYKQPYVNSKASLDIFKTHFSVDSVVGHEGFLAGGEVNYDILDGKITRYNVALGYTAPEYAVSLHAINSCSMFSASYYHRVNSDVEVGGKAAWDSKSDASVALEVGAKYKLDKDAFMKAKVNNNGVLGLGYSQALRPGVKVTLAGSIDTTRLNENAHKIGLSLTLEN